jgi:proline iminopeptidase
VRVKVAGGEVFVDERGSESSPPLLYAHGGPGQSCYDFMQAQGDRLSERLRVVGVDQRGVLRSDDLPKDRALTVDLLIEDFEAVRVGLGLDTWTVLGHSAGGGYALDYALSCPDSASAVIFDCPCWDADLTDRYRLPVAAERLRALGREDAAARCEAFAAQPERLTAADQTHVAMQELGEDYLRLFLHDPASIESYGRVQQESGFGQEDWSRGLSHRPLLEDMYRSRMDLLDRLTQPALLVHGRHDLVAPPAVIERFSSTGNRSVHTFERSGHFAFHEEPEEYARVVTAWVLAQMYR